MDSKTTELCSIKIYDGDRLVQVVTAKNNEIIFPAGALSKWYIDECCHDKVDQDNHVGGAWKHVICTQSRDTGVEYLTCYTVNGPMWDHLSYFAKKFDYVSHAMKFIEENDLQGCFIRMFWFK